ncbi:1828_t:CDS:1 [Entrophospora sp. SA101]|nr:4613_t:CDS:1 [Entrophospora sp. SA101]CAJ0757971.1 1826_t:CDS:1 [Entrophospora sp. SA101]CAJ0757973.1 1828_t:CDS:1 [Entrophospora sp. SA101]CAJ0893032.1 2362_t:CDS:1 [Entrophospora sp. SA101]CAJ0921177.1 2967_t:CDS:1 [Entrophospora sp. SA101]
MPTARRKEDEEYSPSESEDEVNEPKIDEKHETRTNRRRKKPLNEISKKNPSLNSVNSENSNNSIQSNSSKKNQPSSSKKPPTKKKRPRRQNTLVADKNNKDKNSAYKVVPKIVIRNPTKKVVKIFRKASLSLQIPSSENKENLLAPPTHARKKSQKKKELLEDDELLMSLPLPSSSSHHVPDKKKSLIGSMNIQAFGKKKSSNSAVMRIIVDILKAYDIVLCQEIRLTDELIKRLVDSISTSSTPYNYIASHPIGRNTYQERYLFIYRQNEWKVLEDYVVDDVKLGDKFSREPYVVRFQNLRKPDVRITLVGCHTQPEKAFDEIDVLVEQVYPDVKKRLEGGTIRKRNVKKASKKNNDSNDGEEYKGSFILRYLCSCFGSRKKESTKREHSGKNVQSAEGSGEPIVLMGDLNASGSYLNKSQRAIIDEKLLDNNLVWGISHETDTTVSDGNDAAYDRFIFEAANEKMWIGNSKVWRFDDNWDNGKIDQQLLKRATKRVSDHYPIEFELKL